MGSRCHALCHADVSVRIVCALRIVRALRIVCVLLIVTVAARRGHGRRGRISEVNMTPMSDTHLRTGAVAYDTANKLIQ